VVFLKRYGIPLDSLAHALEEQAKKSKFETRHPRKTQISGMVKGDIYKRIKAGVPEDEQAPFPKPLF
jgi:hypothetical protein